MSKGESTDSGTADSEIKNGSDSKNGATRKINLKAFSHNNICSDKIRVKIFKKEIVNVRKIAVLEVC